MVQQIASLKTESAAPALPFTLSASALSVQNKTRQSFDNELLRQSLDSKAFEQQTRQFKQTNATNNSSKESQNSFAQTHNDDRKLASQRQASALQKQNKVNDQAKAYIDEQRTQRLEEIADANKKAMEQSRSPSRQNNAAGRFNEKAGSVSDDLRTLKDKSLESANPSEVALERQQASSTEIKPEGISETVLLPQHDSLKDQFDYIDYVTQLAEFTGNMVDKNKVNQSMDGEVDINQEIASLNTNIENTQIKITIPNNLFDKTLPSQKLHGEPETISLNISNQDLLTIKDLQQAHWSNNKTLSTEEQLELSIIVDDLSSQFAAKNSDSQSITNIEFLDADKALFAELLLSQSSQSKEGLKRLDVDQAMPSSIEPLLVNNPSIKETIDQNDLSLMKHGRAEISGSILDEKLVNADLKSDKANTKQEAIMESANPKLFKEDKKLDASGFSLRNMTQLNEEQSKVALDSLSTRVQAVVSDISGEGKGNEFIAALQSGVKEYKQQLSQGREPGIDLKAIVAEALAQISGENTPKQQLKIDATVNQFNAVLNLANAVNHSVSQQQGQVIGITDKQLAKEFSVQHIEGTKLANGIQNPLNAQASADKAVNIFKHEGQQQLAEKVRWMVNSKSATAEIRLDPPDLGGINIKVNLIGDTAQVNFNVQSAAAKEALDQAAPRLREMLQEQGIELGESVVQQDSQKDRQGESSGSGDNLAQANGTPVDSAQVETEENTSHVTEQRVSGNVLGGIDYYA